jgi:hypothetical protein
MGLPDSYSNFIPGSGLISSLLGPAQMFYNPFAVFSIMDQVKNLDRLDGNEFDEPVPLLSREGIGRQIDKASAIGFAPAPWVNIPMSITGFYGAEDETMPISRHSGIVKGVTSYAGLNEGKGYDLGESRIKGVFDEARSLPVIGTGKKVETFTGSQFKDEQIIRQLGDNALNAIEASPNVATKDVTAPFKLASREGPGNPLWDDAARQVEKVNARRAFTGFVVPLPTKQTSPEHSQVYRKRAELPEGFMEAFRNNPVFKKLASQLIDAEDMATGVQAYSGYQYPQVLDTLTGKSADYDEDYDPTQLSKWGGTVWGPDKPFPFNNFMAMQNYLAWLDRTPDDGSPRSPQAFFDFLGIAY